MSRAIERGAVLVSALLLTTNAWAISPGDKCEADKLKTAGKYVFCRMGAEAKAIKTASAPNYGKCDAKYLPKWTSVEGKAAGACPVTGDAVDIQAQAISCTDGLASTIGGNPPAGCTGDLLTCEGDLTVCGTDLATCESDLAAAELCGNGAIDAGEDCDPGMPSGATCVTEGFAGGVLSCSNRCAFDTSGCWNARFADNADGTITDNTTGLQWEKKVKLDVVPDFANPHDVDNYYKWSGTCAVNNTKDCQPTAAAAALCAAHAEGGTTGCDECTGRDGICGVTTTVWTVAVELNATSFAGHTDWRVPTRQELESILDLTDPTLPNVDAAFQGASCGVACANITSAACSCTYAAYWSVTSYAPIPQSAWVVSFHGGYVVAHYRYDDQYVRFVRSGS